MRTQNQLAKYAMFFVVALAFIGCAKPSGNDSQAPAGGNPPGVTVITGTDTHPLLNEPGATVDIILDGTTHQQKYQRLTQYVATHPLNNPTDFKLNVQLADYGGGKYGGIMKLGYRDVDANNVASYYIATVETGYDSYQAMYSGSNVPYGTPDYHYNRWFTYGNKQVFHAFFQDTIGAVILVIDDGQNAGDGGGYTTVNGSLWFKNFQITQAQERPDEKCWFIYGGPYQCRTFLSGGHVNTFSALYPSTNDGYIRLGGVFNLDKVKAFGQ